ncbi:MAG TPA: alpha/beta hydrolase [Pseudomonadales bacterium]
MKRAWLLAGLLALTGCTGEPEDTSAAQQPADALATPAETPADDRSIEERLLPGVHLSTIESNGIRMRVAEMGEGPVVLLAHGWPESWYSWRHQLQALAAAGYRAVAPDMRGYGDSDAPMDVNAYDVITLAADMVGVLDALGVAEAVMVGHDWGAPVATHSVLLHPERFRALVLMSVPYGGRGPNNPMESMRANFGDSFFYMLYHNEPEGVAEAEYDANVREFLFRIYQSPNSPRQPPEVTDPARSAGGWMPRLGRPLGMPAWLSAADLDYYVSQFEKTGFRGGLNYYRNIGRDWELTEHLADAQIGVPTLFIAGAQDLVIGGASKEELEALMADTVPDLREVVLLPEVGHWVQQEAAGATNEAMLSFLTSLSSAD